MYQPEIKRTAFFILFLPYELLAMAAAMMFVTVMNGNSRVGAMAAMLLLLGFCTAWMRLHALRPNIGEDHEAVDIWAYQRDLMEISDQSTPDLPMLTKDSLLYVALIAEEFREKVGHVLGVLDKWEPDASAAVADTPINHIKRRLDLMNGVLHASSEEIRHRLQGLPDDWTHSLTFQQAKDLLDDTTDVAVVTAGFCIATGLPGREAYQSVVESNISKANPKTGMIDKLPDGKWIKGSNYQEPQLDAILHQHIAANLDD